MIRQTSRDSYNANKEFLSERRWQIYNVLWNYGPLTGGEVFQFMKKEYGESFVTNSNTVTRLGELRDMGVVSEIGEKTCSISGQNVILWDVTNQIASKLTEKKHEYRFLCFVCNKHFKSDYSSHPSENLPLINCTGKLEKWRK